MSAQGRPAPDYDAVCMEQVLDAAELATEAATEHGRRPDRALVEWALVEAGVEGDAAQRAAAMIWLREVGVDLPELMPALQAVAG